MSAGAGELVITKTSAAGGGVETITGLTYILNSSVYTTAKADIPLCQYWNWNYIYWW